MTDGGDMLHGDEFFGDVFGTPKEGTQQHKKREELKSVIDKDKAHLLGKKSTHERVDKASNKTINKTYAEYRQCELNEKRERTGKATGISQIVKIKDVHKLRQEIENDLIIKDQIAGLSCFLVCTFGNFLAAVLVALDTVNNLDIGDEQGHENEDYEVEGPLPGSKCMNKSD